MKLLVVVDMQNDFIDGALGTEAAKKIVPFVKEKIKSYLDSGDKVIYTRDTHSKDYLDTQEGKYLPVTHCVKGTRGWEIADEIFVEGSYVIDKPSFGSMELAEYIAHSEKPEQVELVGLCTDICVISNAMILKAKMPEVPITVDASCCAGVTVESHKNALCAMKMCQIKIIE